MRILTIVGARPQFIKAAVVSRAIAEHNRQKKNPFIHEEIVHTGQHYDVRMSQIFFDELGLPPPVVNLGVGSGTHGQMTARMLEKLERLMEANRPDWVLVYGDTNSTLAGALAAAKLHIPIAHVEAGLRSFNRRMPEEINRVVTDHLAQMHFCPTQSAVENLAREGITKGVFHVGDVMYDAALVFAPIARQKSRILETLQLRPKQYYLATIHRAENTDQPDRLAGIWEGLRRLAKTCPVVVPLHPRTRHALQKLGLWESADASGNTQALRLAAGPSGNGIRVIEPVGFLDMIRLEEAAALILTDSGGVQKEAYFHQVPCVTLRDETEWVETVQTGWNRLAGSDPERIQQAVLETQPGHPGIWPYGDGTAAEKIVRILLREQKSI
ncbi:MAG: UDP-N-acetylglucosamine 2-epimerase (non-hydrolyzing) [Thermoguttaceae bacterium]|nr:UDP-N-acetylglucosamine 2-epimerase (non-hydrolyzing) [Thermoguttaceae bacterium]MDW8038414.1 UDP-N-acetylglucosamine 2-epimerase (non-hydrolyzing) [Thermoguttaceae bacterium]